MVVTKALADTNFFVNILASTLCGSIPTAIAVATAPNRDAELSRVQTSEGAIPIAAAVAADVIAHSIPGLNVLFSLVSEPAGAAAGVAYITSILLSSPKVDPNTLEPKGTVLAAETADDSRGAVRVPFTRIAPTTLKVIDFTNDASSGAGWTIGPDGLPKLPINSVLLVLGVGGLVVEAAAHGPVLSFFFPRVLQVAGWLALSGYFLDKRE
jgi:hypothetical protein